MKQAVIHDVATTPRIMHREAMEIAAVENAKFAAQLRSFEPDDWMESTDCVLWDVRAVAAGIVCHLLMGQSGHQGAEDVDVSGIEHAGQRPALAGELVELESKRKGRRGRLETRDRPLEQKLMAYDVVTREPHQLLRELDQRMARVVMQRVRRHPVQELVVAISEHQVVQTELRVEVGVKRRLTQVDSISQIPERYGGKPVTTCQHPGLGQDPGLLGLPAPSPPVDLVRLGCRHSCLQRNLSSIDYLSLKVS